jgi:uncharacterized protein YbjT (DUF2867 family)
MIVITTPTGTIGRQVLKNVIASGESVRVIVRDVSRLPAEVRRTVEVVEGSHADPAVVNKAFAGADSVFWLVPADRKAASAMAAYVDFARPALEAFRTHKVQRVVGISALGRGFPKDAGHVTATLAMDDLIASTGVAYRAVTNPSFMDNILRQVASIKNQGLISSPTPGELKAPTCATRDIAAVAVKLLLDSTWTGTGSVSVLGPEDLSFNDMAKIISEALGKPVRFARTPDDEFKATLQKYGFSEPMAQAMLAMAWAKNEGLDNLEPRTPQNTTPTTFRQWCEEVLRPAVFGS